MILDHAPRPGPQHWDWRCLRCSHPVAEHGSWRERRRWRIFRRRFAPCACGCGRIIARSLGWDGYHGAGSW